jgi:hypothetical protein
MNQQEAERIETKLETILRVLAWSAVDGKSLVESVEILSRLGLDRNQIAAVCDTTPLTVSVRLSEAKRGRKVTRRRRRTQEQTR